MNDLVDALAVAASHAQTAEAPTAPATTSWADEPGLW
jgi:hypothetical protein